MRFNKKQWAVFEAMVSGFPDLAHSKFRQLKDGEKSEVSEALERYGFEDLPWNDQSSKNESSGHDEGRSL